MHPSIPVRFALLASALLPACNQLEAVDQDTGGGSSMPPVVRQAFEESCGKAGCHTESGVTPPLAGASLDNLVGTKYVTIGDLAASEIAVQMLPDATLVELGVTRPNPLRMPLDLDYFNPNNYTILAWIAGAEFEGGEVATSTGGEEESTAGSEESTGGDEPLLPTWANVKLQVVNSMKCSCHGGTPNDAANGNFIIDDMLYDTLVNAPSDDFPDKNLVTPMDPDNSYLYMKLVGAPGILGGAMPLGVQLPEEDLDLVKRWIEAGAPND